MHSRWRLAFAAPVALALCWCLGIGGCSKAGDGGSGSGRKLIVCTTTMIADIAKQVGGETVQVVGLLKTGMDPHIYDPTPDDSIWFRKADLVLVNGLHLEGRMLDMVEHAGSRAIRLGEDSRIRLRQSASAAAPDPHVWWNAEYFIIYAEQVAAALERLDPAHAEEYRTRAAAYIEELKKLHAWVRAAVASIPENARYMITSHDAFYYYGEAYGLEVDAVLGISTDAQARADDPARLARVVSERRIPAIFHETSVSAAENELVDTVMRLAREKHGHEVRIAGPLYSDSLGHAESGADTYVGAMRANTRMIVEALGGNLP